MCYCACDAVVAVVAAVDAATGVVLVGVPLAECGNTNGARDVGICNTCVRFPNSVSTCATVDTQYCACDGFSPTEHVNICVRVVGTVGGNNDVSGACGLLDPDVDGDGSLCFTLCGSVTSSSAMGDAIT